VENFPETTFLITEVREKADSAGNTHEVFGNLKIKETTRLINFPAVIEVSETEVRALAAFSIDRTLWDVRFGSDKFFDNLGDGAIDNFFDVKVNLLAKIES
jgi:polyisoprenoid-binding protein YceI